MIRLLTIPNPLTASSKPTPIAYPPTPKTDTYTFHRSCIVIRIIRQAPGVTDSYCWVGKLLSSDKELWLWPSSLCIILFLILSLSRGYRGASAPHHDDWWSLGGWLGRKWAGVTIRSKAIFISGKLWTIVMASNASKIKIENLQISNCSLQRLIYSGPPGDCRPCTASPSHNHQLSIFPLSSPVEFDLVFWVFPLLNGPIKQFWLLHLKDICCRSIGCRSIGCRLGQSCCCHPLIGTKWWRL